MARGAAEEQLPPSLSLTNIYARAVVYAKLELCGTAEAWQAGGKGTFAALIRRVVPAAAAAAASSSRMN